MEEEKNLPETEEEAAPQREEKPKSMFQLQKESWYDKIPLNVKQLDMIIIICWILLILTGIAIVLDAKGIISPFG